MNPKIERLDLTALANDSASDTVETDLRDHLCHFLNNLQGELKLPELLAAVRQDPTQALMAIRATQAVVGAKQEIARALLGTLQATPRDEGYPTKSYEKVTVH